MSERDAVAVVDFVSYEESVPELMDRVQARGILKEQSRILIKPNLVNASPHPVTTPAECCAALIDCIRGCCDAHIVIAEGCGAADRETDEVFEMLGYTAMAEEKGVPLIDLNHAETVQVERADCTVFPRMHLPRIAFESYIISVPVLKAHSLAEITGSMKNMMGLAPPVHYQRGGHWKKSSFHRQMHRSIVELNRYVSPHLTLLDATVGLAEYHLGGAECDPPVGRLLGGQDALAVDRKAADLLGMDWRAIPHLAG